MNLTPEQETILLKLINQELNKPAIEAAQAELDVVQAQLQTERDAIQLAANIELNAKQEEFAPVIEAKQSIIEQILGNM